MTFLNYHDLANGSILSAIETKYSALKILCHEPSYYLCVRGEIVVNVLLYTPCNSDKYK